MECTCVNNVVIALQIFVMMMMMMMMIIMMLIFIRYASPAYTV